MKIKRHQAKFRPITITIESEEELNEIGHALAYALDGLLEEDTQIVHKI